MSVGTIHITGQIQTEGPKKYLILQFGGRALHSVPYEPGGGHHVREALESFARCNGSHPALSSEQFHRVRTYLSEAENGGCTFADEEDLGLILNEPQGSA
ncbi:MAG: hypothetical protein QF486_05980 [Candidatus Woesearchaeota archaeon]|nr:hypothetical protein [Candidatus Woesearchaeota archaeon]MDP7180930.1 hypothetical protein [Candidatus Woesearchaeota archaeon]MDP7199134.1 hypothetical protein [Candidatus Woesearchaeota archaeon]MDP7467604.1 hypothetical protein [Candidatus Woesearchaeota archaeon]MDP7647086.1 hypothetical protein [Candidatus Woesearchaeota archaeon]